MEMSRRSFLAATAAGLGIPAAAAADRLGGRSAAAAAARPICIFSKHLQWLEYREACELAAEIGFDGIDYTVRPGGHVHPERVWEDLPKAVAAARAAGLRTPLMTTAITDPDDPTTIPILRTAAELGITHYRMGYIRYSDELGVEGTIAAHQSQIRGLAELNAEYGLHGAYQNHAGARNIGGPVWDLYLLLRDLDPQWIGCQYDIRHATVEGGQAWPLGLKLLSDHIQTTAIKDFYWKQVGEDEWRVENVRLGDGMVNFDAYFQLVKERGIAGPISLHIEYPPIDHVESYPPPAQRRMDSLTHLGHDLRWLRAALQRHGLA